MATCLKRKNHLKFSNLLLVCSAARWLFAWMSSASSLIRMNLFGQLMPLLCLSDDFGERRGLSRTGPRRVLLILRVFPELLLLLFTRWTDLNLPIFIYQYLSHCIYKCAWDAPRPLSYLMRSSYLVFITFSVTWGAHSFDTKKWRAGWSDLSRGRQLL